MSKYLRDWELYGEGHLSVIRCQTKKAWLLTYLGSTYKYVASAVCLEEYWSGVAVYRFVLAVKGTATPTKQENVDTFSLLLAEVFDMLVFHDFRKPLHDTVNNRIRIDLDIKVKNVIHTAHIRKHNTILPGILKTVDDDIIFNFEGFRRKQNDRFVLLQFSVGLSDNLFPGNELLGNSIF